MFIRHLGDTVPCAKDPTFGKLALERRILHHAAEGGLRCVCGLSLVQDLAGETAET